MWDHSSRHPYAVGMESDDSISHLVCDVEIPARTRFNMDGRLVPIVACDLDERADSVQIAIEYRHSLHEVDIGRRDVTIRIRSRVHTRIVDIARKPTGTVAAHAQQKQGV